MAKVASSTVSTGGAGTAYEHRVGAMFLTYLLTQAHLMIFKTSRATKVSFQTKRRGWETDDILVECATDENEGHKLAIQAKLSISIQHRSKHCIKTFQGFWKDFNADQFNPTKDALAIATAHSNSSLQRFGKLVDCARDASDEDDFRQRLDAKGSVSSDVKKCKQVIHSIVNEIKPNTGEKELWRFLKVIHVCRFDFTTSTGQAESFTKHLLEVSATGSDAGATWNELVAFAAESAAGGRTVNRDSLPDAVLKRHSAARVSARVLLSDHSDAVLASINSTIAGRMALHRGGKIAETAEAVEKNQVVILAGGSGNGKSALAKEVVRRHMDSRICLSFRAEEFAESHIDRVLPNNLSVIQLKEFLGSSRVLIHVESLERLLEHSTRDAFSDLVGVIENHPDVCLLLTCRDHAVSAWSAFFERRKITPREIEVPPFSMEEVQQVVAEFPHLDIPMSYQGLNRLLQIPYHLNMAARMSWSGRVNMPSDIKAFRERCWRDMIRKDGHSEAGWDDLRERTIVDLSMRRARELRHFVPAEKLDLRTLAELRNDGIVIRNEEGLMAPAHDIIEDWAVMSWIESLAAKHEWQAQPMAKEINIHPAIRRGFREWLKEKFASDDKKAYQFVLSAYGDSSLSDRFRDDVMVCTLLSDSVRDFLSSQKDLLFAEDASLLVRLIHLTRIACKKELAYDHDWICSPPMLLVQDGVAWPALLEVVAGGLDVLIPKHTKHIVGLLDDWSTGAIANSQIPDGAASAGRIAYRLLEHLEGSRHDDARRRVLNVIARVPCCDRELFLRMVKGEAGWPSRGSDMAETFRQILIAENSAPACRDFPREMAQLTLSYCLPSEDTLENRPELRACGMDAESSFGLEPRRSLDFLPVSAKKGPFSSLLIAHSKIGIKLILDLVNHAGDQYGKQRRKEVRREPTSTITISLPGHCSIRQRADQSLWLAYRGGMSTAPYVAQCALMALESWLLDRCRDSVDSMDSLLLDILKGSNNVMTTAVIASVCNAYPHLCRKTALVLLKSRECIDLDAGRVVFEGAIDIITTIQNELMRDTFYRNERKESNARHHRKHDLVTLAHKLQSDGDAEQVQEIIIWHQTRIQDMSRTDADREWLLTLHLMDLRNPNVSNTTLRQAADLSEDEAEAVFAPLSNEGLSQDVREFGDKAKKEIQMLRTATSIWTWALKQWRTTGGDADAWSAVLDSAKKAVQNNHLSKYVVFQDGPKMVAAVCIRDHFDELAESDKRWCIDTLIAEIEHDSVWNSESLTYNDQTDPAVLAAAVLPKVLAHEPNDMKVLQAVGIAVTHLSADVFISASDGIARYLQKHSDLLLRCAGAVAMLLNLLSQSVQQQVHGGTKRLDETNVRRVANQTRRAFVQGLISAEKELKEIDLRALQGKYFFDGLLWMLAKLPDLDVARDLFTSTCQELVRTWSPEHKMQDAASGSNFSEHAVRNLAHIVLTLPSRLAPRYYRPLLDAVDSYPDDVSSFIALLVCVESEHNDSTNFWNVWQAFADRIIDAEWSCQLNSDDSKGASLVSKMMLNLEWDEGVKSWQHIIGQEERINRLVTKLPPTPQVFSNLAHYLYHVGDSSLPHSFVTVAELLRKGNAMMSLDNPDTVYCLAVSLQRHVYDKPAGLKADPKLRTAIAETLDHLVDAGSPEAYKMRDDFVTPGNS